MPGAIIHIGSISSKIGGRDSIPVRPEYRPHFRVGDGEYLGVQFLKSSQDWVTTKTVATVQVSFVYHPDVNYDDLKVGTQFQVLEGRRIVGIGVVKKLID